MSTKNSSDSVSYTFTGLKTRKYFSDPDIRSKIGDNISLAFRLGYLVEPSVELSKIDITITYELFIKPSSEKPLNSIEVTSSFHVINLNKLIVVNGSEIAIVTEFQNLLVDISLHHARAIHAIEMQKDGFVWFIPIMPKGALKDAKPKK